MELVDISFFPEVSSPIRFINETRLDAPAYLQILIEQLAGIEGVRSLQELSKGDITPLLGGKMSILYAIRARGRWVVVKFRSQDGQAEIQALKTWRRGGANVIDVISHGTFFSPSGSAEKVHYAVLEAVVDPQNQIARSAQAYLEDHPAEVYQVARSLGETLAGMHQAVAGTSFGEVLELEENLGYRSAPQNWGDYLVASLEKSTGDLLQLGIPPQKIVALKQQMKQMQYPQWGVLLHGDFSLRNAALVSSQPVRLKVFDPNPIIGHPSWDFRILANNREFSKKRFEFCPNRPDLRIKYHLEELTLEGALQGYQAAGGIRISPEEMAAVQLMHCLHVLPQKVFTSNKEVANTLESWVVQDTLVNKINLLIR